MPAEAQAVRQLFDAVAPHYDRLNDLLSLGSAPDLEARNGAAFGSRCR